MMTRSRTSTFRGLSLATLALSSYGPYTALFQKSAKNPGVDVHTSQPGPQNDKAAGLIMSSRPVCTI